MQEINITLESRTGDISLELLPIQSLFSIEFGLPILTDSGSIGPGSTDIITVEADWDAPEGIPSHIKNRTHFKKIYVQQEIRQRDFIPDPDEPDGFLFPFSAVDATPLGPDTYYQISFGGVPFTVYANYQGNVAVGIYAETPRSLRYINESRTLFIHKDWIEGIPTNVLFEFSIIEYVQLDEKFLPDYAARFLPRFRPALNAVTYFPFPVIGGDVFLNESSNFLMDLVEDTEIRLLNPRSEHLEKISIFVKTDSRELYDLTFEDTILWEQGRPRMDAYDATYEINLKTLDAGRTYLGKYVCYRLEL